MKQMDGLCRRDGVCCATTGLSLPRARSTEESSLMRERGLDVNLQILKDVRIG